MNGSASMKIGKKLNATRLDRTLTKAVAGLPAMGIGRYGRL
jgi:hypothetical protein